MENFKNRPILAIDYGSKVIGLAKFTLGLDPFPLIIERIIAKDFEQIVKALKKVIEEECIEIIIVGVPYLIDGKATTQSQKNIDFKNQLASVFTEVQFYLQDETLTTKEAIDRMKNSPAFNFKVDMTKVDSVSAVIILEDFIQSAKDKK